MSVGVAQTPPVSISSMGRSLASWPTAVQAVALEQLMAVNAPVPLEVVTYCGEPHEPDVSVMKYGSSVVASSPTAVQSVASEQLMALSCPS
jgi:hypothetical protein